MRHGRAYRRLEPLWELLVHAFPAILHDPGSGDRLRHSPTTFDRVIEIRDGLPCWLHTESTPSLPRQLVLVENWVSSLDLLISVV